MISQILGDRYQVQEQLGKNPGRQPLLARDMQTEELVVVKVLSFGSGIEWDALKLFQREAETLKTLSHPAIPRYLDYFELNSPTGSGFALVQTYVEGRSLSAHLKAGRTFSETEVKQIASSLLEILIYLHGRQPAVIHRDIKPSNILLTNRSGNNVGEVYLVDFGSVQNLAAREGGTMTVVGTYGYMPPEQFGGRAVPASDLYGLGTTLIYLVTGIHPADLPEQDLRIQFEQAVNLSPTMINWLRRMTEPSLSRRLASAQEALQALEQQQLTDVVSLVGKKPTGSKVLLNLGSDFIEIIIPSKEAAVFVLVSGLFAFALNLFMLFLLTIFLLALPLVGIRFEALIFLLFLIPFCTISMAFAWTFMFRVFGRVKLRIDRQRISLKSELFGFKRFHNSRPALRHDISKLIGTKRSFIDGLRGNTMEVKPRIIIWAGVQKFEIGGNDSLTEPEVDWLAHELSYWLGLPIAQE